MAAGRAPAAARDAEVANHGAALGGGCTLNIVAARAATQSLHHARASVRISPLHAQAVVCASGAGAGGVPGFGTSTIVEILTLAQTRKRHRLIPVPLYGSAFWNEVFNFPRWCATA
jgi:predicted Rossmann-fold nucleotide-binding protein